MELPIIGLIPDFMVVLHADYLVKTIVTKQIILVEQNFNLVFLAIRDVWMFVKPGITVLKERLLEIQYLVVFITLELL